jgi:hypothetical protein
MGNVSELVTLLQRSARKFLATETSRLYTR